MSTNAATQPLPRTVWRDDLVAALTGGLLILGLFLDGWNHLNLQQGRAGDFLTPWHGLLYAGFNACAIWAITRNPRLRAMMLPSRGGKGAAAGARRAPQIGSAQVALLGLGLAGAGVIGDAVARAAGLVADRGAMQPPFDFLLFTGAGLVFAIALRAAAAQIEGFGRRVAMPIMLGVGAAAAVVLAFGGQAATKSVDKVVRTIAAQPSVSQSAPRTLPATHHARHAAVSHHAHARVHAHRARHSSAGATIAASATASPTHSRSSSQHATRTVVVHHRAVRHVAAAPHRRSVARPAPHKRAAHSKGRFQQVAIPDAPSDSAPANTTQNSSSSSGSSSSAPAATAPAASPTAGPTPTTSNPPATSPPATPPTAAKHGGPGQG